MCDLPRYVRKLKLPFNSSDKSYIYNTRISHKSSYTNAIKNKLYYHRVKEAFAIEQSFDCYLRDATIKINTIPLKFSTFNGFTSFGHIGFGPSSRIPYYISFST